MKRIKQLLSALLVLACLTGSTAAASPRVLASHMAAWSTCLVARALPPQEEGPVQTLGDVQKRLADAIRLVIQPTPMDVSALDLGEHPAITVQNLFNAVLADEPALKYAHGLTVTVTQGRLRCTIAYMPYKTGRFPAGFDGVAVSDQAGLLAAARAGLGEDAVPIRITNPAMEVDDMNRALQQVGGAEVLCTLNRDATAIVYTPTDGRTLSQCLDRLSQSRQLAQNLVQTQVKPGMSETEIAQTLYSYLTQTVRYDQRYYADPASLPYASRTAYGALHSQLAICGGYALSYQLLLEQAGIVCYTVSGKSGGEYHMWNVAQIDGQWLYFDPTADRGRLDYGYRCFGVEEEALTRYTWDKDALNRLIFNAQGGNL